MTGLHYFNDKGMRDLPWKTKKSKRSFAEKGNLTNNNQFCSSSLCSAPTFHISPHRKRKRDRGAAFASCVFVRISLFSNFHPPVPEMLSHTGTESIEEISHTMGTNLPRHIGVGRASELSSRAMTRVWLFRWWLG